MLAVKYVCSKFFVFVLFFLLVPAGRNVPVVETSSFLRFVFA